MCGRACIIDDVIRAIKKIDLVGNAARSKQSQIWPRSDRSVRTLYKRHTAYGIYLFAKKHMQHHQVPLHALGAVPAIHAPLPASLLLKIIRPRAREVLSTQGEEGSSVTHGHL